MLTAYQVVLGTVYIEYEGNVLTGLTCASGDELPTELIQNRTPFTDDVCFQLEEYLAGKRKKFEIPCRLEGTEFQKQVWNALQEIPYGQTWSYGELARAIGNPKACRAVGMANNRNPIQFIIPCHRVIGADGKLVGYGGGLAMKAFLLDLEKSE